MGQKPSTQTESSTNQFHMFRGQGKASQWKWYLVIDVSAAVDNSAFPHSCTWKDFTFLSP